MTYNELKKEYEIINNKYENAKRYIKDLENRLTEEMSNKIIEYNGKIYKINKFYDGISNNWVEAEFWYKDRWIEVINQQICIDLRRFIDNQILGKKDKGESK